MSFRPGAVSRPAGVHGVAVGVLTFQAGVEALAFLQVVRPVSTVAGMGSPNSLPQITVGLLVGTEKARPKIDGLFKCLQRVLAERVGLFRGLFSTARLQQIIPRRWPNRSGILPAAEVPRQRLEEHVLVHAFLAHWLGLGRPHGDHEFVVAVDEYELAENADGRETVFVQWPSQSASFSLIETTVCLEPNILRVEKTRRLAYIQLELYSKYRGNHSPTTGWKAN
jgi:hypothetical protein